MIRVNGWLIASVHCCAPYIGRILPFFTDVRRVQASSFLILQAALGANYGLDGLKIRFQISREYTAFFLRFQGRKQGRHRLETQKPDGASANGFREGFF